MENKGRTRFQEMSLTQQLLGIIMLFIVIFLSFFFIYLNGNIDGFVRTQMENVIDSAQEEVINNYQYNQSGDFLSYNKDLNTAHLIRRHGAYYQTKSYRELPREVIFGISNRVNEMNQTYRNDDVFEIRYGASKYLVKIHVADRDEQLVFITTLSSYYQEEFKNTLVNSVINAIFLVVFILFGLLLVWVTGLLHSLRQIQTYVDKISRNEPATLEIERKDEIGDVANALVFMNNELRRQEQVKEELIQNISHDLKTPIATIKSYGESIKDGIYPYDTLEKSVDVIIEHANRLEQKVHSLLMLNRMEYLVSGQDVGDVNMKDIISKTILSLKAVGSDVEIRTNLQDVLIKGEEEPWRVVCENILENALRYAESYIEIELNENQLSFRNDGIALTEEVEERMFKPYEKGSEGGFGMGLSIVKTVVDAYGYIIYAENTEDGVVFIVDFIEA